MKSESLLQAVLGLFVGMVLVGLAMLQLTASPADVSEARVDTTVDSIDSIHQTTVVSGTYYGLADLNWVLTGVYSSTLATPTPEPGGSTESGFLEHLDLALRLEQAGTRVSGHVVLDRSLAFPELHTETIDGEELAIGPRVSGTFDGETLQLQSERFDVLLSPEKRLSNGQLIPERKVTRQFSLISTSLDDEGNMLVGEFRETLWGFDVYPSTVIGEFTFNRPVVGYNVPTVAPTVTPGGPTSTPFPPTATVVAPTATPVVPTVTPGGPTVTPNPPTVTPIGGEIPLIYLPITRADAP